MERETKLKKIVINKTGGYGCLEMMEGNIPVPQKGQVLIRIAACGVNYADCVIRWGLYESANKFIGRPITPGFEFSGTILAFGPEEEGQNRGKNDVDHHLKVGDAIFGLSFFGAYATHIVVPVDQIFPLPPQLTMEEAAGFPTIFITAYHALFQNIILRPEMNYLVHSAAGGVGGALVQLIKLTQPGKLVGVVGSSHKVTAAYEFGATAVIDKSRDNLWQKSKEIASEGYDVILDANGASTLKQSYYNLRPTGKLIAYGFHSMFPQKGGVLGLFNYMKLISAYLKTPRFNPIEMTAANKSLVTFNLSFLFERDDLLREAITQLITWLSEGKIKPSPITSFPLEKVGEAHQTLESGKSVGKIILNCQI